MKLIQKFQAWRIKFSRRKQRCPNCARHGGEHNPHCKYNTGISYPMAVRSYFEIGEPGDASYVREWLRLYPAGKL